MEDEKEESVTVVFLINDIAAEWMVLFREMEIAKGWEDLRVKYLGFSTGSVEFEIPMWYSDEDVM